MSRLTRTRVKIIYGNRFPVVVASLYISRKGLFCCEALVSSDRFSARLGVATEMQVGFTEIDSVAVCWIERGFSGASGGASVDGRQRGGPPIGGRLHGY